MLYLEGRPGGSKTYLAVFLSAWLQSAGLVQKTVTNFPCAFAAKDINPCVDAAIVLDETWMFITNRQAVYEYAGFVRKVNSYVLMQSVYRHRLLTRFRVARCQNLYAFGLPAWVYRWDLNRETMKERGYFAIIHPERMFGVYDTRYIPCDDGGIVEALTAATGRGKRAKVEDEDQSGIDEIEDAIGEGAEEVSEGSGKSRTKRTASKKLHHGYVEFVQRSFMDLRSPGRLLAKLLAGLYLFGKVSRR